MMGLLVPISVLWLWMVAISKEPEYRADIKRISSVSSRGNPVTAKKRICFMLISFLLSYPLWNLGLCSSRVMLAVYGSVSINRMRNLSIRLIK